MHNVGTNLTIIPLKNNLKKLDRFGYLDQIIDLKQTDIEIDEYIINQDFTKMISSIMNSLTQVTTPDKKSRLDKGQLSSLSVG